MKLGRYRAACLTVAAAAWAITTATALAAQAPPVDISGKWKLNVEASNNPNGPAPTTGSATKGGGSAPKGGGRGGGGEGGDPRNGSVVMDAGGNIGPEEMARLNNGRKMFETAPAMLTIEVNGKDVTLTYNDGNPVFKHTVDKSNKIPSKSIGELEFKLKWDGKTLKREISTPESLRITEVYSLSPDGKQLIVTEKSESNMTKIPDGKIKRVYDKVM